MDINEIITESIANILNENEAIEKAKEIAGETKEKLKDAADEIKKI